MKIFITKIELHAINLINFKEIKWKISAYILF